MTLNVPVSSTRHAVGELNPISDIQPFGIMASEHTLCYYTNLEFDARILKDITFRKMMLDSVFGLIDETLIFCATRPLIFSRIQLGHG